VSGSPDSCDTYAEKDRNRCRAFPGRHRDAWPFGRVATLLYGEHGERQNLDVASHERTRDTLSESTAMSIRLVLADDHPVMRGGLRALLEAQADMVVIGEAEDGIAAVKVAEDMRPDVVVMDVSMPNLGGAEATARIKERCPEVRILGLTAHEDRGYVQLLLKSGASGYVLKRTAADDLVRAVRAVAGGGLYVDPGVAAHILGTHDRTTAARQRMPVDLSDREAEVVRLIAQGYAMKEMAARLDLSARTLETYKARAMEKLGLRNRADIVRYALQRGWLKGG
jgi:DNA-binding NarL/FixJ family response regulator